MRLPVPTCRPEALRPIRTQLGQSLAGKCQIFLGQKLEGYFTVVGKLTEELGDVRRVESVQNIEGIGPRPARQQLADGLGKMRGLRQWHRDYLN